jgi:hypothetical protein
MNGAEKYRACFLCHLSLSLLDAPAGPCECSVLRKKCHPHRRRSVIKRHFSFWCGALIDFLYYYMGDIMRLLTERKGLQRVLFVGVDGTNGAVKLQRGRISKGDHRLLSCCFETGASPNTFLRLL